MSTSKEFTSRLFLAFATVLLAVGTLMVYSASMSSLGGDRDQIYLSRHLVFLTIAVVSGWISAQLPASFWRRIAPLLLLTTIALLVATLLPGVGHRVNGAQRWIRIGSISIQASETAKFTLPLWVCAFLTRREHSRSSRTLRDGVILAGVIGLTTGLILVEPDLGTALFVGMISVIAVFLCGWPLKYFAVIACAAVPAFVGLFALKPYQMARIQGFVRTWQDPDSAPYQVQQSLTTIGVGGFRGKGLGQGWQKLSFLPEANTDFIFAVIGEELGLIGTLGVIALWIGLYLSGLRLVRGVPEQTFAAAGATTLLTQFVLQAAINVAVVTAMVPPKGISHPLISYGGSNLVTNVTILGIILSLTRPVEVEAVSTSESMQTSELEIETDVEAEVLLDAVSHAHV